MLNILFSKYSDNLVDVNEYFDHSYEDWWFEDGLVKDIIAGVDNSGVEGLYIKSPVLGTLPVTKLSEGCKACIILYMCDDISVNLTSCGENCQPWLLRIADLRDITCCYTGVDIRFEGFDNVEAVCMNDNTRISGWRAWIEKMMYWWVNGGVEY